MQHGPSNRVDVSLRWLMPVPELHVRHVAGDARRAAPMGYLLSGVVRSGACAASGMHGCRMTQAVLVGPGRLNAMRLLAPAEEAPALIIGRGGVSKAV